MISTISKTEIEKKNAGEKAVEFIKDNMTIGLGSGTTVYWFMKELGERIDQGLNITAIPTSKRTEYWAKKFGIPLVEAADTDHIDLTIDGANEIDRNLNLIKGGGGSLVREKIIGNYSKEYIIIVNHEKKCEQLGNYPVPIEVIPFGWRITSRYIERLGCEAEIRKSMNSIFISDNGNYILDCKFGNISNPVSLHSELKMTPGVIETGLFIDMTDKVILGQEKGVVIIDKKKNGGDQYE